MHAALGAPLRLAIVDHLGIADAAPGELGTVFGIAPNLLAHHLRVLEDAGLVRRVRSEGDRRRTYVQLCLDDPLVAGLPGAGVHIQAPRVVFVCTHNSARSQLAAAAWNRVHSVVATSAGTRPATRVHRRAITTGGRHGLRLGRARTADAAAVLRPDDLVVAVCDNAYEELTNLDDSPLHWAVPDPARIDTDTAFERAYQEIARRVGRLAQATAAAPHAAAKPKLTTRRST